MQMNYEERVEQFEKIFSYAPMEVIFSNLPKTNSNSRYESMLESVLGVGLDYYSVFNQFDEEEFQDKAKVWDEWFQVYIDGSESEPWFNVFIVDDKMVIEQF